MVSQCNRSDHFRNGALVCVFVRACNSNEVFGKKSSRRMAVWPCVAASNPISSRRRTKATVETANLTCFTGLQNKPSGLICGGLAYRPTDSLGTVSSPPRQKKKTGNKEDRGNKCTNETGELISRTKAESRGYPNFVTTFSDTWF